ncbi:hypothetical protein HU200_031169 [Digitaria exilis]|uniref:Uncharacterized protein n=1 Tax=Digitaria exilis TaxID=1010633 RepID=A0A835ETB0_9POAL|nr:hypothetical protein HU200_031169 [Digitaria exilis]
MLKQELSPFQMDSHSPFPLCTFIKFLEFPSVACHYQKFVLKRVRA